MYIVINYLKSYFDDNSDLYEQLSPFQCSIGIGPRKIYIILVYFSICEILAFSSFAESEGWGWMWGSKRSKGSKVSKSSCTMKRKLNQDKIDFSWIPLSRSDFLHENNIMDAKDAKTQII